MRIKILGSGTSHGVPMIGCYCPVCTSSNPKNKRFRPSILVENEGEFILVDTTPEMRMQALAFGVDRVDSVLFTHTHADHFFGLDDVRRFNDLSGKEMPVYGDARTLSDIRRVYDYIFKETQMGGGKPRIELLETPSEWTMHGLRIQSFTVMHGKLPVLGYRFNDAAYVTDVSFIPEEAKAKLRGLDLLILDAVRPEPHPTHLSLQQAVEVVEELQPTRALFTHLSHHFEHDEVCASLPDHVDLAYDGQVIEL